MAPLKHKLQIHKLEAQQHIIAYMYRRFRPISPVGIGPASKIGRESSCCDVEKKLAPSAIFLVHTKYKVNRTLVSLNLKPAESFNGIKEM